MTIYQLISRIYHNSFNLRLGLLAIPFIGGIVALVNIQHGWSEALRAGTVAGITGFFVSGVMTRVIQHFAVLSRRLLAYSGGTLLPTLVTLILHLGGQSANQTPELLWSILAPTLLTLTTSLALNFGTYYFLTHEEPRTKVLKFLRYFFSVPEGDQP